MDQSKSNNVASDKETLKLQEIKRRRLSVEFVVGVFTLVTVMAAAYLAVGLGGLEINGSNKYEVYAEFDDVSGLKHGATVEIAGVPIGEVTAINLNDPVAVVTLKLDKSVSLRDDDILAVRTKGIIGDRYVKVIRGASDKLIGPGQTVTETESVVDFEDIVGKIVHSLTGKDDEEGDDI